MADVKILISAEDNASKQIETITQAARAAGEGMSSAGDKAAASGKDIDSLGVAAESAGGKATEYSAQIDGAAKSTGGLDGAATSALTSLRSLAAGLAAGVVAESFLTEMTAFRDKMAEVSTLVDTSTVDVQAMGFALAAMAPQVATSTSELAAALYEVISAGVGAGDALGVVEVAAVAAKAGVTDAKTVIDGITSVLNAYGLAASEAGRISDIMFTGVAAGKTTFDELANSIGTVTPLASTLGISFEEATAAIAALTLAGLSTSEAATALRSLFSSLIQSADEFRDSGIDIIDVISERGLAGALAALEAATGGNIEKMRELVPDVQGLNAALALAGETGEKFASISDMMTTSVGATDVAFGKMKDSGALASDELGASFSALAASASATLGPAISVVLSLVSELLSAFKGLGEFLGSAAGAAVNVFESAFLSMAAVVGPAINEMGAAMDSFKSAVSSLAGELAALLPFDLGAVSGATGSWHSGGIVQRLHGGGWPMIGNQLAADEIPAILRKGEFVMSRPAVAAIGADTLASLNRGSAQTGGTSNSFAATINISTASGSGASVARDIDAALADLWRYRRSQLRRAMEIA